MVKVGPGSRVFPCCIGTGLSRAVYLLAITLVPFGQVRSFDSLPSTPPNNAQQIRSQINASDAASKSLRINVDLVLVPVRVTDTNYRPVTSLDKKNFELYEDEQPQDIEYFSTEDAPLTVGLLLDLSKSMTDKFDTERAAVSEFFKTANQQDDYFVVTFSNRPKLITDSTHSLNVIQSSLGLETPDGNTSLLDAVFLGMTRMQAAQYRRRALLIISDGGDNHSRHHFKEIKRLIQDSDVDVYAIGIFDTGLFKTFEESMGRKWLNELTNVTGGHTIAVENLSKLPEAAAVVSREMRDQYVLGYHPTGVLHDHTRRKIKIQVTPSEGLMPVHASYRTSYLSSDR